MLRILLITLLFITSCTKPPKDWTQWTKERKDSFKEKFAVPTVVHHIYLNKNGDQASIRKEDKGFRFTTALCKENCLFMVYRKNNKIFIENNSKKTAPSELKENENSHLKKNLYISYKNYKDLNETRIFLYDLGQKDLIQKRKRSFFNYDKSYKVTGKFKWLDKKINVTFGRSDQSQKVYQIVATINYVLSNKKESLNIYNFNKSVALDKNEKEVMLMFRDGSNNKKTYGAGRFLGADLGKTFGTIKDGDPVILDFNYSYNPPCATSTGYHCPLPQDTISSSVIAGERYYKAKNR